MSNLSSKIRNFLRSSGSTIMSAEFLKKDGTIRQIRFNPKDRNELSGNGFKKDPDIINIRDLDLARKGQPAWRAFNVNNLRQIKSNGITYSLRFFKETEHVF